MAKYRKGQCVRFNQQHCNRPLALTGYILSIEYMDEIVYHVAVDFTDGTLFALVREYNIYELVQQWDIHNAPEGRKKCGQ